MHEVTKLHVITRIWMCTQRDEAKVLQHMRKKSNIESTQWKSS